MSKHLSRSAAKENAEALHEAAMLVTALFLIVCVIALVWRRFWKPVTQYRNFLNNGTPLPSDFMRERKDGKGWFW